MTINRNTGNNNKDKIIFEVGEKERILEALKKTHKERFLIFTKLMRMSLMLQNAKSTHQPFIEK